jgi:DNA-binding HxlR family transcriptional regulator
MRKQKHSNYKQCPIEATLDVIGGKWKGIILYRILENKRRFNELRRLIPTITQRMLTLQLRELERDGLINRTIYPVIPPKVEYELTDHGRSLVPILNALKEWGERHLIN